jgi:peptidoglycan/xylan/chitin deacetylase (PgdA/CDA1 family)
MNQPLPFQPVLEPDPEGRPFDQWLPSHNGATALGSWRLLSGLRDRLAAQGWGTLFACLGPRVACGFGILMYHRVVARAAGAPAPTWNVTPARFRAQIEGLLARGYRPWPLKKVLACHQGKMEIPPQTFVITFDDGFENVYSSAFPILREYRVPATVFVATAYLDAQAPFPFDDWPCAGTAGVPGDTWRPLTTVQCEEMLASGLIELGSHTHVHADFRKHPADLRHDLALSLEVLRTRFGIREATFAFPFGYGSRRHDGPALSAVAKEAGMLSALTTESELIRAADDPFNWGRFTSLETDTAASLAAKLGGWYSLARHAWQGLRRGADRARRSVSTGTANFFSG